MEISNNRIKVTSMKTFAKFFLHFSLVMLSCLTTGCTSEVETIGATPEIPENPQANDPNRRSVVISLQNKLILVNGTPESRAITRDGIAEEDETALKVSIFMLSAVTRRKGLTPSRNVSPTVRMPEPCPRVLPLSI